MEVSQQTKMQNNFSNPWNRIFRKIEFYESPFVDTPLLSIDFDIPGWLTPGAIFERVPFSCKESNRNEKNHVSILRSLERIPIVF